MLSDKPLLTRKEEQALAAKNIRVMTSSKVPDGLLNEGHANFGVIILDDSLRGIDLYETCRRLRATTNALIILLGSAPSWEMWEKSQEIGFDRYYKKPVPPQELETKIKLAAFELDYKSRQTPPNVTGEPNTGDIKEKKTVIIEDNRPEPPPSVTGRPESVITKAVPEPAARPGNAPNIWQEPRLAGLMSGILSGKIKQLSPEINLALEDGFTYREAETVMGTKGKETALILESLAKNGILLKQEFEKILQSPGGSFQLVPVERCPQCDSSQLVKGQLIEHFSCGYIGLEEEFIKGVNQVCPKCKHELKLIGTDYRKPGMRYICHSCHGIFPSPVIKCRDMRTGEVFRLEELREVALYIYRLNEEQKKRLEFELEPKRQLIDCLVRLGYEVKEAVQVQGRSGATHTIDLVASMDDIITRHTVAVGVLVAPHNETEVSIDSLFTFDSKVYDTGIDNKMVIAVPGFSSEAMKFAERQGIRVYRMEDLRTLLTWKNQEMEEIAVKKELKPAAPDIADLNRLGPRSWLKSLLEKKGYRVAEKFKVAGRSGAEHILDLYAEKDDGIINHKLAACVVMSDASSNNDVNDVIQFDTAAYDARIRDKIVISVTGLSKEAGQFAEYQRIKVLEAKDLAVFPGRPEADETAGRFNELLRNHSTR